jgi:hypothetical protein
MLSDSNLVCDKAANIFAPTTCRATLPFHLGSKVDDATKVEGNIRQQISNLNSIASAFYGVYNDYESEKKELIKTRELSEKKMMQLEEAATKKEQRTSERAAAKIMKEEAKQTAIANKAKDLGAVDAAGEPAQKQRRIRAAGIGDDGFAVFKQITKFPMHRRVHLVENFEEVKDKLVEGIPFIFRIKGKNIMKLVA